MKTNNKSYKKVKKEDKNKKKLKTALKNVSTKTQLPKGQNLTDINFKVKKIVIRDQVKPHDANEILYRKKLNVSELATRLTHHNVSIKTEALDGLKELITNHPVEVLGSYHIQVLESVVKLVLDETSSIRKTANKIVAQVLSAVPQKTIVHFFNSLNSYLICGLTHINKNIREDALTLLDSCLTHVPSLCEKYAFNLLAVCLDLISEKNIGSRTLSLNLESAHVVSKWRIKVLGRINSLVNCLLNGGEEVENKADDSVDVKFSEGDVNYFPIYGSCELVGSNVDVPHLKNLGDPDQFMIVEYTESIVPLLLGMFLEVHPNDKSNLENKLFVAVNEETSNLLNLIVSIILSLWELIGRDSKMKASQRRISNKFAQPLLQALVLDKFPYSTKTTGKVNSGFLGKEKYSNVNINLLIARLIIAFTDNKHWAPITQYLKSSFQEEFSNADVPLFAECVAEICREESIPESRSFFSRAVKVALESKTSLASHFFRLLGRIALDPRMKTFHEHPHFSIWLESLPEKVTKPRILPYQMDLIAQIAVRNFPPFLKSLDVNIELILDNIPKIEVHDESRKSEVQQQMARLAYWVQDWDDELTQSLKPAITNEYWGETITKLLVEIIDLKSEGSLTQSTDFTESSLVVSV